MTAINQSSRPVDLLEFSGAKRVPLILQALSLLSFICVCLCDSAAMEEAIQHFFLFKAIVIPLNNGHAGLCLYQAVQTRRNN